MELALKGCYAPPLESRKRGLGLREQASELSSALKNFANTDLSLLQLDRFSVLASNDTLLLFQSVAVLKNNKDPQNPVGRGP